MTFQEALLTLAQNIISDDYETALTTCDGFPELEYVQQGELRSQLMELLGDVNLLNGKDVNAIIDKFNLEKVEPFKAIIQLQRDVVEFITADKIKTTQGYQLAMDDSTEYFNDIERATLFRQLATKAVTSRNLDLIKEVLAKVQKYGI